MTDHPFQPGTRVAVDMSARFSRGDMHYKEDFVLKVYKNGNFTLKSDPKQQWRAWSMHGEAPSAIMTGDSVYGRRRLKIWNEQTDAEIQRGNEAHARKSRWLDARKTIEETRYDLVTDRTISLIEEAIRNLNPIETKA